jgi:hypothetical protein
MACDPHIISYLRGEGDFVNDSDDIYVSDPAPASNVSFVSGAPVMGGQAFSLSQSLGSYIQVSNFILLNARPIFTCAGWFKVTSFDVPQVFIMTEARGGPAVYVFIDLESGEARRLRCGIYDPSVPDSWACVYSDGPISVGTWYHFAWVKNNTTGQKLYLNGVDQTAYTTGFGYNPGYTGSYNPGGSASVRVGGQAGNYTGILDEFVVFDRALNSSEVSTLYAASTPYCDLFTGPTPPRTVAGTLFLNVNGSNEYPFDTEAKGATSLTDFLAAIPNFVDGDIIEFATDDSHVSSSYYLSSNWTIDVPNITIRSYGTDGTDRVDRAPTIQSSSAKIIVTPTASGFKCQNLRFEVGLYESFLEATGVPNIEITGNKFFWIS